MPDVRLGWRIAKNWQKKILYSSKLQMYFSKLQNVIAQIAKLQNVFDHDGDKDDWQMCNKQSCYSPNRV